MKKIYDSNNELCHMIFKVEKEEKNSRTDIAPPDQFIQVSHLNFEKGKTFRPHKHIWKPSPRKEVIAQESWCVVKGTVKAFLYDAQGKLLHTEILTAGEISLTFQGGHTYEILEDAEVYEYKTGPYEGQSLDKEFI